MKPNIILIMVDQMRGDCLGINGHPVVETPNLDMMAGEGYNFKNAYSAVPSCIAARAALMTGMNQRNHGRVGYKNNVTWNYKNMLAETFAKNDYYTQCVGKMHVHPERSLCGFHNILLHNGYSNNSRNSRKTYESVFYNVDDYLYWLKEKKGISAELTDSGLDCNSWVARSWPHEEQYHPTNWVVNEGINFLRRRDKRKNFFLKLSFIRPHSPLDPPEYYYNMYINREIDNPIPAEEENIKEAYNINAAEGQISKEAMKRAKVAYYGSITHIDHQIGRFLMVLKENDLLKESIVLFVSDHGDLMGDHGLFRKSMPYQGSIHVPFIVYDPGNFLNGGVMREPDELVELRDIMPSLLDFCNIEIPDTVDGKSIKEIIENKPVKWREYLHGEHFNHEKSNQYIVDKKMKYMWFSQTGAEKLFDLENDPKELNDLSEKAEYTEVVEKYRKILAKELEGREEGYSDGINLITGKEARECLNHILNE